MIAGIFKHTPTGEHTIAAAPISLSIRLFGPMEVCVHGKPMPHGRTRSVEWTLALLALRYGRTVDRSWLAGTLWPDSEEAQALHNLRDVLVQLRKCLGEERKRIQSPTRDTLTLDLTGAEVDVAQFDRLHASDDLAAIRSAVDLYSGPLLEGCYELWISAERATREQACLNALAVLADGAEHAGEFNEALALLQLAERMDPLRDSTVRGIMRVLAAAGDAPAALQRYRDYRVLLRNELDVAPDDDTLRLYELIRAQAASSAQRVPSQAPAPRGAAQSTSPIPQPLTAIIGRDNEASDLRAAMAQSRLVTLVGAGGIGKTRLATHIASAIEANSCAMFVGLAPLSDPTLLTAFVTDSLGIREDKACGSAQLIASIADLLSKHPTLLVIDNCEHLVEVAAGLIQTLLERCPTLSVLATSRQRLGLDGEHVWRVPPLSVPAGSGLPANDAEFLEAVSRYPAIQLFLERALSAHNGFRLERRAQTEAVCRICERLDGTPLAIELAAARVRSLTVEDISNRLDQRFRLLTGGSRSALPRQQTLKSLIDWSYDLLNDEEKAVFVRTSVFAGGWSLDAAVQICAGNGVDAAAVMDILTSLVDKSLVYAETSGETVRYSVMETMRQYARDRLQEADLEDKYRTKHVAFCVATAEWAALSTQGTAMGETIARIELEQDNLRVALDWCLSGQQPINPDGSEGAVLQGELALRLCTALEPIWRLRGRLVEGRSWFARALDRTTSCRSLAKVKALNGSSVLANVQGDFQEAVRLGLEAVELLSTLDDKPSLAAALHCLGNATSNLGDSAGARSYYERSLVLRREIDDRSGIGALLHNLGSVSRNTGDFPAAQAYLDECVTIFEEIGHRPFQANACISLGRLAVVKGDSAGAQRCFEQALAIERSIGNPAGIAGALTCIGNVALDIRQYSKAKPAYDEALTLYRDIGDRSGIGSALCNLASVARKHGDTAKAKHYLGECITIFQEIGYRLFLANAFYGLAITELDEEHLPSAREHAAQSLELRHEIGDRLGASASLDLLAGISMRAGAVRNAALMLYAAQHIREEIDAPIPLAEREEVERVAEEVRAAVSPPDLEAIRAEAYAMTTQDAVELALLKRHGCDY